MITLTRLFKSLSELSDIGLSKIYDVREKKAYSKMIDIIGSYMSKEYDSLIELFADNGIKSVIVYERVLVSNNNIKNESFGAIGVYHIKKKRFYIDFVIADDDPSLFDVILEIAGKRIAMVSAYEDHFELYINGKEYHIKI